MKGESRIVWTVIVVAVLLILAIDRAQAAQFEVGAGVARADTHGNGTWYQEGFPHTLRLTQPIVELGLKGRITPHMDWHLDAVWLGRYSVNSLDVAADENYSASSPTHCNGPCLPLANYIGSGHVWGVQALLARHTDGDWQLGVEGGPFLYHETWRLDVPDWYPATTGPVPDWYTTRTQVGAWTVGQVIPVATYGSQWALGYVVGITLAHGRWNAALRYYHDGAGFPGHVGAWPPIWSGHAALVVGYTFGGAE